MSLERKQSGACPPEKRERKQTTDDEDGGVIKREIIDVGTREQERQYEELSARIDSYLEFRAAVDELRAGEYVTADEVREKLGEVVDSVVERHVGTQDQNYAEQIDDRRKKLLELRSAETDRKKLKVINTQLNALMNERSQLMRRSDELRFISSLRSVRADLVDKKEVVDRIGTDKDQLVRYLSRIRPIEGDDIVSIEADHFNINVTLTREATTRLLGSEKAMGLHVAGTPVNLVADGLPVGKAAAIKRHEMTHGLFDGAQKNIAQSWTSGILWSAELDSDQTGSLENMKKVFTKSEPREWIDDLQDEILAELENAEDEWLRGDGSAADLDTQLQYLGTAGAQVNLMRRRFDQVIESESGDEMFAEVREKRDEYLSGIDSMIVGLRDGFIQASQLGDEAEMEVHTLAYLTRPSEYHKIPDILRKRHDIEHD